MNIQSVNAGKAREKSLALLVSLVGKAVGYHQVWTRSALLGSRSSHCVFYWKWSEKFKFAPILGANERIEFRDCLRLVQWEVEQKFLLVARAQKEAHKVLSAESTLQNKSKGSENYRSGVNWNVLPVNGSNDANEKLSTHFPADPKVSLQSKEAQLMWVEINISQAGCAGNLLHYHPLKVSSPRCHPQRCVNFSLAENCKPWKFKGKDFWLRMGGGDIFELFALLGNWDLF